MTILTDSYLWCALQVTIFSTAGALLYFLLHGQTGLRATLPRWCLAMVVVLSLLAACPWPHWPWLQQSLSNDSEPLQTQILRSSSGFDRELLPPAANRGRPTKTIPSETSRVTAEFVRTPTADAAHWANLKLPWNSGFWKACFLILVCVSSILATVRLLIAQRELTRRIRSSVLIESARPLNEFSELQQHFGVSRPVILRESPPDLMPATIGWRRPSILLPQSWREWTPEQRRAVLAHELAHIEQHDFATWLAAQLPILLHSYHPMVHWLARRVRWEQEISADRRAAEVLGDRAGYMAALAELALRQTTKRKERHTYSLAPTSSMLLRRL